MAGDAVKKTDEFFAELSRDPEVVTFSSMYENFQSAGLVPYTWTFSSLITAYAKAAGKVEKTELIFGWMRSAGVFPNVVTFNSLIDEEAEKILERTRSLDVVPDLVPFNGLIAACAEAGDVKKPKRSLRG